MKIDFRVQERKFSSNVIEKGIEYEKENGDIAWKWEVIIAPTCNKKEGDSLCDMMYYELKRNFATQEFYNEWV